MTSEDRSPKEIEREIERERAGLTNTLDELQEKFSVETVVRQVSDQFREHGGDITRSVSRSVKDNPVALALTGIGLAWMIFGSSTRKEYDYDDDARFYASSRRRRELGDGYDNNDQARFNRSADQSLQRDYATSSSTYSADRARRSAYTSTDLPSWAADPSEYQEDSGPGLGERVRNAAGALKDGASSAVSTTGEKIGAAGGAASQRAGSAGSALSGAAKSAGDTTRNAGASAKSAVSNAATSASERAAIMRQRLGEGTENLTEEARSRVIAAREKAMEARSAAMQRARQGSERASDLFEEQPLVGGALALAVGAAIGAALPRSRIEDDYLGQHSDSLIEDAERIFLEEKQKLTKVANAATDEAKKVVSEVKSNADSAAKPGDTAADAVADKVKSSAQIGRAHV